MTAREILEGAGWDDRDIKYARVWLSHGVPHASPAPPMEARTQDEIRAMEVPLAEVIPSGTEVSGVTIQWQGGDLELSNGMRYTAADIAYGVGVDMLQRVVAAQA